MDPEPGEQVFFHGHPSWRSMLGFYLKGVVAAIAAGALAGIVTAIVGSGADVAVIVIVVLVAYAAVLVIAFLRRIATTYTITDQRLTIDTGLMSRDVHETRLVRVQNVNASQSLLERLLRVGTLDFDTSASAEYDFSFRGVADPHGLVRVVDRALHGAETAPSSAGGETPPESD